MLALPFTREEFFSVFARYNTEIWPAPVIAIVLGLIAVAALWLCPAYGRAIVLIVLALFWVWTGVAYHMLFFADINPLAFAFGALFVVEGLLLAAHAPGRSKLQVSLDAPNRAWGWALIFYAGIAYPLLLVLSGHVWPAIPTFAVTPCPLVIFTFGVLLFGRDGAPWTLLVIPLAWSMIGGSAAFLLGVIPDWALPLGAILTVALTVQARRLHRRPVAPHDPE